MNITDEPLVSVVMATYNAEYTMLRDAVESVINQTYTNWELILIDDGSTQYNDFSFLEDYHDSRIKLYHNTKNIGLTKCLNKGVRLSQGSYIARLDADDISLPERFKKQILFLQKHPSVKVVSGRVKFFGFKDGVVLSIPNNSEFIRTTLLLSNNLAHSTLMFRRELFTEDGLYYDEAFKYAQDYDLLVRVISHGGLIMQLPECLVYIRVHDNQISTDNTESRLLQKGFISAVSCRQFAACFGTVPDDARCRDALVNGYLASDVTVDQINEWVLSVFTNNKKTRCYNQHYLRLVFAEMYASFMKITGDSSCLGFVIRRMGLELIQSFFIFCHRRLLKYVYRLKYGSTGTKS